MNSLSVKNAMTANESILTWPAKSDLLDALNRDGYVVFSTEQFSLTLFSELIGELCETLTFDPARHYATSAVQTVDAGADAVGLHIENGNTPLPPDLVSFYSAKSAQRGSQTTVCDGIAVLEAMSDQLRRQFEQPFTMQRRLPKLIWQRYVATAFNIESVESVTVAMLEQFIAAVEGQSFTLLDDGAIDYRLKVKAIRDDNLLGKPAFANALLGPSYNYEAPIYVFADGSLIDEAILAELRAIGERYTHEIAWRDGDVAIIDNKRVMHGRRAIDVPLDERRLYIAMGLGVRSS